MAVGNREALCFVRGSTRATRASRATNPCPRGLVTLSFADRRQNYVRGVALSREPPPKLQQPYEAVVGKKTPISHAAAIV